MKRTCLKHVPPARAQHLSNHIVLLFKRWQRTCSLILIIPARERSPGCAEGDKVVPGDCSHRVERTENPILRHVALIALPYSKVPPDWNEAYNQACSKKTLRFSSLPVRKRGFGHRGRIYARETLSPGHQYLPRSLRSEMLVARCIPGRWFLLQDVIQNARQRPVFATTKQAASGFFVVPWPPITIPFSSPILFRQRCALFVDVRLRFFCLGTPLFLQY